MSELEQLLFEKGCPFLSTCDLRFELEKEKGKRIVLASRIEEYKNDFAQVLRRIAETLALKHYVDRLLDFSGLEAVFFIKREEILDIWTIISESNLNIEERIAKVQCELMRIYENLDFDFMVLPRGEIDIEKLLPKDATRIFPVGV